MHIKTALMVLVFSSCYSQVELGVTKCGMIARTERATNDGGWPLSEEVDGIPWDLEKLNIAEATAVRLLNDAKDERLHDACPKLKGLTVFISGRPRWLDMYGRAVAGNTNCGSWESGNPPWILIGTDKPSKTSLPHEMAHFLQDCKPRGEPDLKLGDDANHAGWHRDGIYDALGWYWTQMEIMGL